MATISAAGIGSGLDVNTIISQLMTLEQRPLMALQQKEAEYHAQLSSLGQLRSAASTYQSAMSGLTSAASLETYTATSADTAKFTATADNTAAKGTYDIQVTNLAVAQKQGSNAFADADTTTIGNAGDQMTLTIGTESFTVEIGGKTLTDIATAINDAGDNVGVTASILQEDASSYRLVLSSDASGTANTIALAFEDAAAAPIADPLGMAEIQTAEDASFIIDGTYTITRSSNTVTDAIQGVTLNLLEVSTSAVQLNVTQDTGDITSAVEDFVDAYNTLQNSLAKLSSGELSGDSTVRMLESRVRSILNTPPTGLSGTYSSLSEIGIAFQKDGTLTLDSDTLSSAIKEDRSAVADLFANDDQGYAFRLDALMDEILDSDGLISARENGINTSISSTQDGIERMETRLEIVESRLRAEFSALDLLVADMQTTGNFLTQQLDILSNMLPNNRN